MNKAKAMSQLQADVVVLGSGPGGYTAAFRAADLGKKVILIEKYAEIGGVCLNVGCIPSKALLHTAKVVDEAKHMSAHGVKFGKISFDIDKIRDYKAGVVTRLTKGLKALASARKVQIVQGYGKFASDKEIIVEHAGKTQSVSFNHCIIAAGSRPVKLPFLPEDERIMDSTGALELKDVPKELLVIGGGIIGLEMAQVYSTLGAKVTIVELADQLMNGADKDVVKPFQNFVKDRYEIMLQTSVIAVDAKKDGLHVAFEGKHAPEGTRRFDRILSAVGRVPNGKLVDAEQAGVKVSERGFITVDDQMRTNVPHIFAIGDIVDNGPMLAHVAVPQGKVAAEVISGEKHFFNPLCIPSVAYTDPEVAWVGKTEEECKKAGIKYGKGVFPWAASGRSLGIGRDEGQTKVLFDEETHRILGAAMVGPNAGELVAEAGLAIEMGADAEDIALTIHAHPTLSETFALATEMYEGSITDLIAPKKKKK